MAETTYSKIYRTVSQLTPGQVASYGEMARRSGLFRGAQLVGWALRALPAETPVPWWRVVNQKGRISIINPHALPSRQAELLEKEGVAIVEREGSLWVRDWEKIGLDFASGSDDQLAPPR